MRRRNFGSRSLKSISKLLMLLLMFNLLTPFSLALEEDVLRAKPLVILMEFADYKFEDIDSKEDPENRIRGVKGQDFTAEYVDQWLFSEDTYRSQDTNGKEHELISTRKILNDISGNTYDFNGDVVGPYTAEHKADYYGKDGQASTRFLIDEAIEAVAKDSSIDLSEFDLETRIRNVDTNETHITYGTPDGQVDTLIVIHPGIGGEWGGGSIGDNAIWPYRRGYTWHGGDWGLKEYETVDHKGDTWRFDDFLIVAQDGASDIVAHEFGHIMGLSDLYAFTGAQPPVQYWDLMGGSYTGKNIPGDGPISYGAYNRYYLQKTFEEGGADFVKWANMKEFDLSELNGQEIELQRVSEKIGDKTDLIKINLPEKESKAGEGQTRPYYLLEWRKGDLGEVDGGLENLNPWNQLSYEPGLLVWYVDESYIDEWGRPDQDTKGHTGTLFAGIVDADQNPVEYMDVSTGEYIVDGRMDYNMHDASFRLKPEKEFKFDWGTVITEDRYNSIPPYFDDSKDYSNEVANPEGGLILDELGLKIMVLEQNNNSTSGKIKLINKNNPTVNNEDFSETLGLEDIEIVDNAILLKPNKDKIEGLGEKAYIVYSNKKTGQVTKLELELESGVYEKSLDFFKNIVEGDYEISFIVLENKAGDSKAVYNSKVHPEFGVDLSEFDFNSRGIGKVEKLNRDKNYSYINGYPDNTIRPEGKLTREEAASIIFRILDEDYRASIKNGERVYLDVSEARWSEEYIATLSNAGIIKGYEGKNFRPENEITRAEVLTMLSRLMSDKPEGNSDFKDVKGHWAENSINYGSENNWIKGYEDGSFRPDQPISRAEFVTVANNILGREWDSSKSEEDIKSFKDLKESKWYYSEIQAALNPNK